MKTEFKVGMEVYDGIGVGVVCGFHDGYPIVTFIDQYGSDYHFHFSDADIEYLKEYNDTN